MSILDVFKRRVSLAHAYRETWESPVGRIVLLDLLREGGVLETSVVDDGSGFMTNFKEGRRSLATHIMDRLRWQEGELVALAAERTAERLAQSDDSQDG